MVLRNIGKYLPVDTVSQDRRSKSPASPLLLLAVGYLATPPNHSWYFTARPLPVTFAPPTPIVRTGTHARTQARTTEFSLRG
jgi:hypothetical protein